LSAGPVERNGKPVGVGGIRCGFAYFMMSTRHASNRASVIRIVPACWQDLLRGCNAVEVFDLFHGPGLATQSHRHHCLAALRGDKTTSAAVCGALQTNLTDRSN
jgi:hypothetical protein